MGCTLQHFKFHCLSRPRLSAVMLLRCLFPAHDGQSAFLNSTWQMLSPEDRGRGELRGSAGERKWGRRGVSVMFETCWISKPWTQLGLGGPSTGSRSTYCPARCDSIRMLCQALNLVSGITEINGVYHHKEDSVVQWTAWQLSDLKNLVEVIALLFI